MKKILIATTNQSKFKIVSELLKSSGFNDCDFFCLKDIDLKIEDKPEQGDILNRAKQKALDVYNNLSDKNIFDEFDIVLGVDDGIEIKSRIEPNVKKILPDIFENKVLQDNEIVNICRAFYFLNSDLKHYGVVTKIPFMYKTSQKDLEKCWKESSYPLSYVLYTLNSNKTVSELDEKSSHEYYLSYCKEQLNNIKWEK